MIFEKINIKSLVIIVFASSILGFVYNALSPTGIPLIYSEKEYKYIEDINLLDKSGKIDSPILIPLERAFDLYKKNTKFLDARDQWDFAEGHIVNAINIPEYKFDPSDNTVNSLPKDEIYVIYCGGDDCDISKRLANELDKLGFTHLYIYIGGFTEWEKLQLPIEK